MPECPFAAVAMHAYPARKATELSIAKGETITVEGYAKKGWVAAHNAAGARGYVPQHFIAPAPPAQDGPETQQQEPQQQQQQQDAVRAAAEAAQAAQTAAAEALAAVAALRVELARRDAAHAAELAALRETHARDIAALQAALDDARAAGTQRADELRAALAQHERACADRVAPADFAAAQRRVGELERAVREQVTLQHVAEKQLVRTTAQLDALQAECARVLGAPGDADATAPGGLDLTL